jgi:putative aldouronate transport system substrate-binding protein
MRKLTVLCLALMALATPMALLAAGAKEVSAAGPVKISMFYSDNATLPFRADWLTVVEAQKRVGADVQFEVIPIADYKTKVSLALNTGTNAPDVILYQSTAGENAALALNGAIVPISDYASWTPNFNAMVQNFGLQADVDKLKLKDGKRYFMPALFDVPFYDGGLILREDLLVKYGLEAPKTYDDLYNVLRVFKQNSPDSLPLTILAGPRVLYRMTMPAWGISVGKNGASGTNTLSWNYATKTYFAGATSDQYRQYITAINRLYREGLLDPEMAEPISGDRWAQKLATGKATATYAYYDQIGGVTQASTIPGFKLQMYPALAGPAGAHHQPKSKTGGGPLFPAATARRADFERVVRAVDEMFFSPDNSLMWGLGVEGVTYTKQGDRFVFSNDILSAPEGIYKYMQVKYGSGSDVTQMIWVNAREMTKYDANYARINAEVEAMGDVIQAIPPTPLFDDRQAEEAASLQTPLADAFERWNAAFLDGTKSIQTDWAAYLQEMRGLGIEKFVAIYNDNLR